MLGWRVAGLRRRRQVGRVIHSTTMIQYLKELPGRMTIALLFVLWCLLISVASLGTVEAFRYALKEMRATIDEIL